MTDKEAIILNRNLYLNFGHTLQGLWGLYKTQQDFSIQEFNDFVYDKPMLELLATSLRPKNDTIDSPSNLQSLSIKCYEHGMPIGIFSNAPLDWCMRIINAYNMPVNPNIVFTSSHPLFLTSKQRTKPDITLYNDVAAYVKHATQRNHIIFIDDSVTNLVPLGFTQGWTPIHYEENDHNVNITIPYHEASLDVFNKFRARIRDI